MSNRRGGMTFLEIVVVTTIISLMAMFTIPSMRGPFAFNRLRTGSREVVSLMRLARSQAVINEVEVVLEIDVENSRYRLNMDNVARKRRLKERSRIKESEEARWRELPENVVFNAVHSWDDPDKAKKVARIIFFPDGSASDSSIILTNERKASMTVMVNRATALAEVVKGIPEELQG